MRFFLLGSIMYALYKALPIDENGNSGGGGERLSSNFTLDELLVTSTGLDNFPNIDQKAWLRALAVEVLQPIRDALGSIRVNSGYRSPEVNTRIGGSPTSQHMLGQAADIISLSGLTPKEIFLWIYKSQLPVKQVILYAPDQGNFVHVSIDPVRPAKAQFLIKLSGSFYPYEGGSIVL